MPTTVPTPQRVEDGVRGVGAQENQQRRELRQVPCLGSIVEGTLQDWRKAGACVEVGPRHTAGALCPRRAFRSRPCANTAGVPRTWAFWRRRPGVECEYRCHSKEQVSRPTASAARATAPPCAKTSAPFLGPCDACVCAATRIWTRTGSRTRPRLAPGLGHEDPRVALVENCKLWARAPQVTGGRFLKPLCVNTYLIVLAQPRWCAAVHARYALPAVSR